MRMRTETPNEIGSSLEYHTASVLGGKPTPQSGAGKWVKLDVRDKFRLAISCKASGSIRDTAMRAIMKLWVEAVRGARGFQSQGESARPAVVFEHNGVVLMLAELDTWAAMATEDAEPYITASKAESYQTRRRANTNAVTNTSTS